MRPVKSEKILPKLITNPTFVQSRLLEIYDGVVMSLFPSLRVELAPKDIFAGVAKHHKNQVKPTGAVGIEI